MFNKKVAIIYGKDDDQREIKDGGMEFLGDINNDELHIKILIDYLNKKYNDKEYLNQISIRHQPEIAAYFLTLFGHVVFLNSTKNINKYGKTGIILMPKNISCEQKLSLDKFISMIDDYSITILYDLNLENGLLDGKQLFSVYGNNSKSQIEKYYKCIESENNKIK